MLWQLWRFWRPHQQCAASIGTAMRGYYLKLMTMTIDTSTSPEASAPKSRRKKATGEESTTVSVDRDAPKTKEKNVRDAARTRANILQAAIAEFSAKGYSGARTEQIAKRARSNIRMLYAYFGGKDELYIHVLEAVLGQLRAHELTLDISTADPMSGILQMFDLFDGHFAAHPELRNLLAYENLNHAAHLKQSPQVPQMSMPVLTQMGLLLKRGEEQGVFRSGIDPLHLYVAMASLVYYSKSHAYVMSRMFQHDMLMPQWQQDHHEQTRQMLTAFLMPPRTAIAGHR